MSSVSIGYYLLARLHELGVRHIHGIPGDYNLAFLDLVEDFRTDNGSKLEWVGNSNELNASYAADGYARVKNSIGALVTTFGVGELSALNGIAGSFSEHVGIVHIVGMPSTKAQSSRALLHHTLGDGDYSTFSSMSSYITIAQTILNANTISRAGEKIDELLTLCYRNSKPVYLGLPSDLIFQTVPKDRLNTPLDVNPPDNDPDTENEVIEEIKKLYDQANCPVILIDACTIRHRVSDQVQELIKVTGIPFAVAPMGKSAVDETLPGFLGVYVGSISLGNVKKAVEGADLIISIGALLSDFNTGSFSYHITPNAINLHSNFTEIRRAHYSDVGMQKLLPKLLKVLTKKCDLPIAPLHDSEMIPKEEFLNYDNEVIKQSWLWTRFNSWLREGDVIVAETGTSSFGILETKFPPKSIFVSQILWGSIGYTVGATLGAALATRELKDFQRRTILFVGDGSFQISAQEVSTMIRRNVTPIIFIINNYGYTIERLIHGADREYNSVQIWNYTQTFEYFGADKDKYAKYKVSTPTELDELLNDVEFSKANKISLVEICMGPDRLDAPRSLRAQAQMTGKYNQE